LKVEIVLSKGEKKKKKNRRKNKNTNLNLRAPRSLPITVLGVTDRPQPLLKKQNKVKEKKKILQGRQNRSPRTKRL
jgi:hypothetical protein